MMCSISLLSAWEADDKNQLFCSPSCWCCFTLHVSVGFVLWILRVTEFSKVRKSSAESKIMRVLCQGKSKYHITGRNLSGLCDFNDYFLHIEVKFVENVSVVWLFVAGASTSDILIWIISSVKEKWENFETWLRWETWLTTSTVGLYMEIIFNLPFVIANPAIKGLTCHKKWVSVFCFLD